MVRKNKEIHKKCAGFKILMIDEIGCIIYHFKIISSNWSKVIIVLTKKYFLRNLFEIEEWAFLHIKVYQKCPDFLATSLKLAITSKGPI